MKLKKTVMKYLFTFLLIALFHTACVPTPQATQLPELIKPTKEKIIVTSTPVPTSIPTATSLPEILTSDSWIAIINSTDVQIVKPNGSRLQLIHKVDWSIMQFMWTPDGKYVTFTSSDSQDGSSPFQFHFIDVESLQLNTPNIKQASGLSYDLSPDSNQLVYDTKYTPLLKTVASQSRNDGLRIYDLTTQKDSLLVKPVNKQIILRDPTWSPIGSRIAYTVENHPTAKGEVFIAIINVNNGKIFYRPVIENNFPRCEWSPDGELLGCKLFGLNPQIWVLDEKAEIVEKIIPESMGILLTPDSRIKWSPDNKFIGLTNSNGIYNFETKEFLKISTGVFQDWTSFSNWILILDNSEIFLLNTKKKKKLLVAKGNAAYWQPKK